MIRDPLVWVALWLTGFGVWPFADPGHHGDTPASLLDLALHVAAFTFLVHRAWLQWRGTLASHPTRPKEH